MGMGKCELLGAVSKVTEKGLFADPLLQNIFHRGPY
jgi:hypothetical protein